MQNFLSRPGVINEAVDPISPRGGFEHGINLRKRQSAPPLIASGPLSRRYLSRAVSQDMARGIVRSMTRFAVRFCWPPGVDVDEQEANCLLDADILEIARMQAAMLYATLEFRSGNPSGLSNYAGWGYRGLPLPRTDCSLRSGR